MLDPPLVPIVRQFFLFFIRYRCGVSSLVSFNTTSGSYRVANNNNDSVCPITDCHEMGCHISVCPITDCHEMGCHISVCPITDCHEMGCHISVCPITDCHEMGCHISVCPITDCHEICCHISPSFHVNQIALSPIVLSNIS